MRTENKNTNKSKGSAGYIGCIYRSAVMMDSLYMSLFESASIAACDGSICTCFWAMCPYMGIAPPPGKEAMGASVTQWESSGVLASWLEPVEGTLVT